MHPFFALLLSMLTLVLAYMAWTAESRTTVRLAGVVLYYPKPHVTIPIKIAFVIGSLTCLYFAGQGWGFWT